MERESRKWVYVMLREGRPDEMTQIDAARVWGASVDHQYDPIFADEVEGIRTTNPAKILVERGFMLRGLRVRPDVDETVFVFNPLCIGLSQADVQQTIEAIWAAGSKIFVHTFDREFAKGDDITELLAQFQRDYTALAMRRTRARGKGRSN